MNTHFVEVTDMDSWLRENRDRLFRFLRYRKVFTPYEIQNAFMDESEFEDDGTINMGIFVKPYPWAETIGC